MLMTLFSCPKMAPAAAAGNGDGLIGYFMNEQSKLSTAGRENDDAIDSNDADVAEEIVIDDAEDCVWSRDSSRAHC